MRAIIELRDPNGALVGVAAKGLGGPHASAKYFVVSQNAK